MLYRQIGYFISKYAELAKFTAGLIFALQHGKCATRPRTARLGAILNRTKASIHDSP
jgi:hypothetical protein